MAMAHQQIILCKGANEKDNSQEAYVKLLESVGYTCESLQTLRFQFVNTDKLKQCLHVPEAYYGLILTSRRAAEAVDLAAKEDKNLLLPWKGLPVYCVGPATESFAKTQLSLDNCLGSQSGNAKNLAEQIISDICKQPKPLLYPCSEIARETIEQTLLDNGINVQKLVTYRTLASESLESDLLKLINSIPKIFVFFSPSGVTYVASILKKHLNLNDTELIKAVAIGPVTKQALLEVGFPVYATAEKPDPSSLAKAIKEAAKINIMGNIE